MWKLKGTNRNVPKYFKLARTIFNVIIFQHFAAPSLHNDAFGLRTVMSGRSVLLNETHKLLKQFRERNTLKKRINPCELGALP